MNSPLKILWVRSEVSHQKKTGGLADFVGIDNSIQDFDRKSGTGFKFSPNDQKTFNKALQKKLDCFADQDGWEPLINNGMAMGFS